MDTIKDCKDKLYACNHILNFDFGSAEINDDGHLILKQIDEDSATPSIDDNGHLIIKYD